MLLEAQIDKLIYIEKNSFIHIFSEISLISYYSQSLTQKNIIFMLILPPSKHKQYDIHV
jgi:hypothetical protein